MRYGSTFFNFDFRKIFNFWLQIYIKIFFVRIRNYLFRTTDWVSFDNRDNCDKDFRKKRALLPLDGGKMSKVALENFQKEVFDLYYLTKDFIQKRLVHHGCSSKNENYHSVVYNRGFVNKSLRSNAEKLSIESGYALGSLHQNLSCSELVETVFDSLHRHFSTVKG